ncbi:MAG: DUF362 domain-containing protein [Candidatus Hodarchaeota archaeon]
MTNIKKWEHEEKFVEVDLDACMGAGNCQSVCPAGVYKVFNGITDATSIEKCIACGKCQGVCPSNVIISHWAWK